jgi:pimeloyl-ACP methyl ester carboxylesterase
MNFISLGTKGAPTVMLIPGLGVSYEIFLPLAELLRECYDVVAVEVDGFTLGRHTAFTSVDGQASQIIDHIRHNYGGRINCIYGLSLGGKILSRILERNEVVVEHAIMDAAPLIALPSYLINPLRYLQCANVWSCYHWRGFWRWVFHSHYFDVLLNECHKIYPYGGARAVLDGYKSVYTSTLQAIHGKDIHYWHGTQEAFVARAQVKHLRRLYPASKVEIMDRMNHGQLLIDHPEEGAKRIEAIIEPAAHNK